MIYLKKFNESKQLIENEDAKIALSKIYNIVDAVRLGVGPRSMVDYLVNIDEFINYADKYDGAFAGNKFDSLSEFKEFIEDKIDSVVSPLVYIAPFWFTRTEEEIFNFGDVYSDTIYIRLIGSDLTREEQLEIQESTESDECDLFISESGGTYLRIWWD